MVKSMINLSVYIGQPPAHGIEQKIHTDDPLYEVKHVLDILSGGDEKTIPWTKKCINYLQNLALDSSGACTLVQDAVTQGKYLNSQWCEQKTNGPWAACDAYRLFRDEWAENAHKYMRFEYYVKFAIGKTGKILLLVSCHPPQQRIGK